MNLSILLLPYNFLSNTPECIFFSKFVSQFDKSFLMQTSGIIRNKKFYLNNQDISLYS